MVSPSPSFFLLSSGSSSFLQSAFARYYDLTFRHTPSMGRPNASTPVLSALSFVVDDLDDSHPQIHTDESYSLSLPPGGGVANVRAASVYGALRAIESFSQLVVFDFDAQSYIAPSVSLVDRPRFPHRGLMIDTARHYQPLSFLRRVISSLPFAKLNVLHWHMADSQSFPFESKAYPELWRAAYSPSQRYTQGDVASIVEYARLHGVRVIVEFDMPGHAG